MSRFALLLLCLMFAPAHAGDLETAIQHLRDRQFEQAAQLLKPLAEAGDPLAQLNLGIMHLRGDGVARDPVQARQWLTRAAEAGDPRAMNELGILYYQGIGVEKNYSLAHRWFSSAAERGVPESQSFMGDLYRFGRHVKQDYAEAVRWYEKSAAGNYPHAFFMLGVLHGQGLGVAKDRAKSIAWYERAVAAGYPGADKMLQTVRAEILQIESVSTDPEYGYRHEKAIRTGGMSAARQHAYLGRLRGPRGEKTSYRRTGACAGYPHPPAPFGQAIVDCYEVRWEGLTTPKTLFLDLYRSEPLQAPAGFTVAPE